MKWLLAFLFLGALLGLSWFVGASRELSTVAPRATVRTKRPAASSPELESAAPAARRPAPERVPDPEGEIVITGRVLDDLGEPRTWAELIVTLQCRDDRGDARVATERLYSNKQGRFSLRPNVGEWTLEWMELLHGRLDAPDRLETRVGGEGRRLARGVNDLGDVVLARPPLLVRGVVVDAFGAPVPRAHVAAARELEEGDVLYEGGAARGQFADLLGLVALTDRNGAFELRGHVSARRIRVRATSRAAIADTSLVCPVGEPRARLCLTLGGSLRGTVLVEPHLDRVPLELELVPETTQRSLQVEYYWDRRTFHRELIPPGPARLHVRLVGQTQVFHSIEGVQILPGEECRDPRLDPLDLRGLLLEVKVVVQDTNGELLHDAEVEFLSTPSKLSSGRSNGATHTLLGLAPSFDLVAWAPGYLAQDLRGVDSDRVVQLEPGAPLTVRVEGAGTLQGHELLTVRAQRAGPGFSPIVEATVDEDGSATLVAPAGECSLSLRLATLAGSSEIAGEGARALVDSRVAEPVHLTFDESALESARHRWIPEGPLRIRNLRRER